MTNTPNYRLPVKREPSPPPAPIWQQAAPVVVRGAALVAAGIIGEWLLRSAAKKAASASFSTGKKKARAVATVEKGPAPVVAYRETIVVERTVIRRE
jgi:hypothetical protein